MRRRSLAGALLLLGLLPATLLASAFPTRAGTKLETAPSAVVHSKYAAVSRGRFYRLSWIDNDRLFFAGEPIAEIRARFDGKRFVRAGKTRFYVWNTRSNEVTTYKDDAGPFGSFCFNENESWIRYPIPGKKDGAMEGKFGEEREIRFDPLEHTTEARVRRQVFFQEQTCHEHPYAPEGRGVGNRRVFPLFGAHGILDVWGKPNDATPVRLFTHSYEKLREFELPRRAFVPQNIYYSKYKRAYVLTGYTAPPSFSNTWGSWPKGVNQPVYLLSEEGELSLAGEIPWREGFRASLAVFPTARGLVYATGRPPKEGGVFLVVDGKAVQLLRSGGKSRLSAAGVSPDGCKVAVALSLEGANKYGGVKVIGLCPGSAR